MCGFDSSQQPVKVKLSQAIWFCPGLISQSMKPFL